MIIQILILFIRLITIYLLYRYEAETIIKQNSDIIFPIYVAAFSAWLNGDLTGSMEGETSFQLEKWYTEVSKRGKKYTACSYQ